MDRAEAPPVALEGMAVSPQSVKYQLHKALASLLCTHELNLEVERPCRVCLATVDPLVLPIARTIRMVVVEAQVSVGKAVEQLIRDGEYEQQQLHRRHK